MKHGKDKTINRAISMGVAVGTLVALWLALPTFAGSKPSPGQSSAFGKTLGQWEDIYVRCGPAVAQIRQAPGPDSTRPRFPSASSLERRRARFVNSVSFC